MGRWSDLSADALDRVLSLQFPVAWAGEAAGDPPRRGWWKSDLVDPQGGGDLFARLVPKTAAWASRALHHRRAAASVSGQLGSRALRRRQRGQALGRGGVGAIDSIEVHEKTADFWFRDRYALLGHPPQELVLVSSGSATRRSVP